MQSAQWVHLRPRRAVGIAGVVVLALAVIAEAVLVFGPHVPELGWVRWALPVSLAYFALIFWVWLPYRTRRTFKQRKDFQREASYAPSESELIVQNDTGRSAKPWADYLKWKEGRRVFLLYLSDNMFQVVPKHFFSSDAEIEEFRSLLQQKVRRGEA